MNGFLDKFFDRFIRCLRFRKIIKQIPKNSIVCDLGCGRDFRFLKTIAHLTKYGIGFDKAIKNSKDAKIELRKRCLLKTIPLKDSSVGVVTMLAVLEHLNYPQAILRECCRVLKKGGKLIISTPTPLAKPVLELLAFKLKLIDEKEIREHKNYFSAEDLKRMLEKAGFKQKNTKVSPFECRLNNLAIAKK